MRTSRVARTATVAAIIALAVVCWSGFIVLMVLPVVALTAVLLAWAVHTVTSTDGPAHHRWARVAAWTTASLTALANAVFAAVWLQTFDIDNPDRSYPPILTVSRDVAYSLTVVGFVTVLVILALVWSPSSRRQVSSSI